MLAAPIAAIALLLPARRAPTAAAVPRAPPCTMGEPAVGDFVPEQARAALGIDGTAAALFFINRDDVFEDFKITLAAHQSLDAFGRAGCKPVVIRNPERGGALPSKKDNWASTAERFSGLAFYEDVDNGIRTALGLPMGGWVGYPRRSLVCDSAGKIQGTFDSQFDPQAHVNYALKVLRDAGAIVEEAKPAAASDPYAKAAAAMAAQVKRAAELAEEAKAAKADE